MWQDQLNIIIHIWFEWSIFDQQLVDQIPLFIEFFNYIWWVQKFNDFSIAEFDLRNHAINLMDLYNVDADDFIIIELLSFRIYKKSLHLFDFTKSILTKLWENEFLLQQFLVSLMLILALATADCRQYLSAINR